MSLITTAFLFAHIVSPSGLSFGLKISNIMNKEKYISVKDYALKEIVSEKTIYNWIKSGKIPKSRVRKVLSTTLIKC